jgi:hypothetical protein
MARVRLPLVARLARSRWSLTVDADDPGGYAFDGAVCQGLVASCVE